MRKIILLNIFFLFNFCFYNSYSQKINNSINWQKFNLIKDPYSKYYFLQHYLNQNAIIYNTELYDSLIDITFKIAYYQLSDSVLLNLCAQYATNNNNGENAKILKYYLLNNKTNLQKVDANILFYNTVLNYSLDSAKKYLEEANYQATFCNDNILKIKLFLANGTNFDIENNKINAYRCFLDAHNLAIKIKNKFWINKTLDKIVFFFKNTNNLIKAKYFNNLKIKNIYKSDHIDSIELIKTLSTQSDILYRNIELQDANQLSTDILDFSDRNNYLFIKTIQLEFIKTHCLNFENYEFLNNIYNIRYPNELQQLANTDYIKYLNLKAFFAEHQQQSTLAKYYYDSIKTMIDTAHISNSSISYFNSRIAQFYAKNISLQSAKPFYINQYNYAIKAKYYPWVIEATAKLKNIDSTLHDYKEAYYYLQENIKYQTLLDNSQKSDELLKLDIENENRQREIELEQHAEQIEKKHSLQYMAIFIALISCFIALAILGSSAIPKFIIRGLAFISFIFFFEFVILILDEKIHKYTNGEPLKIMGIKIVLISFLLPFHHWVEHQVIHYLNEHRLFNFPKIAANIKLQSKKFVEMIGEKLKD